jgi:hypothetical protein
VEHFEREGTKEGGCVWGAGGGWCRVVRGGRR